MLFSQIFISSNNFTRGRLRFVRGSAVVQGYKRGRRKVRTNKYDLVHVQHSDFLKKIFQGVYNRRGIEEVSGVLRGECHCGPVNVIDTVNNNHAKNICELQLQHHQDKFNPGPTTRHLTFGHHRESNRTSPNNFTIYYGGANTTIHGVAGDKGICGLRFTIYDARLMSQIIKIKILKSKYLHKRSRVSLVFKLNPFGIIKF